MDQNTSSINQTCYS